MVNVKHFIKRCNNIKGWMLNTLLTDVIILNGEC